MPKKASASTSSRSRLARGKRGRTSSRRIRVLLADDHLMVREGLRTLVERHSGMQVIGEAGTGRECVALARKHRPDVVVMDVSMPDGEGTEAARQILSVAPKTRIIALSAYGDASIVKAMLRAGAHGYVLKTGVSDDLMSAIGAALAGKRYLSPELISGPHEPPIYDAEQGVHPMPMLRPRERQVLRMLADGQSSKKVASCLAISVRTVESHRRNISKKLGLYGLAELTKYAIRHGIIDL